MDLSRVIFISSYAKTRPSIQIRSVDIAEALGCRMAFNVHKAEDVPGDCLIFICVKLKFRQEEILKLAKRGPVLWDILDTEPPRQGISCYLVSSTAARSHFNGSAPLEMIPHHHCNKSRVANPDQSRRPVWLGHKKFWYPDLKGFDHDVYDVENKTQAEVVEFYRKIGIGLNIRRVLPKAKLHVTINSGIKLINCMGFGIPSVSDNEPAYKEFGEGCTLFTDIDHSREAVLRLQNDADLYARLRHNCLDRAEQFHITTIAKRYKSLFLGL